MLKMNWSCSILIQKKIYLFNIVISYIDFEKFHVIIVIGRKGIQSISKHSIEIVDNAKIKKDINIGCSR